MGNTSSVNEDKGMLQSDRSNRKNVKKLFWKHVRSNMSNIELITISTFSFGCIKELNDTITYEELMNKLGMSIILDDERGDIVYKILKGLSNWPLISDFHHSGDRQYDEFTLNELIIIVYLLYCKGFKKVGLDDEYVIRLIFKLISKNSESIEREDEIDIIFNKKKTILWNLMPIIQSYDNNENEELGINEMETLIKFLLPLSINSIYNKSFELKYKIENRNILRCFINGNGNGNGNIKYQSFIKTYRETTPLLINPIYEIFNSMMESNNEINTNTKPEYKILTLQKIAQISTVIDIKSLELNTKAIYRGSRDGFSINSFTMKVVDKQGKGKILCLSGNDTKIVVITDGQWESSHRGHRVSCLEESIVVISPQQRVISDNNNNNNKSTIIIGDTSPPCTPIITMDNTLERAVIDGVSVPLAEVEVV